MYVMIITPTTVFYTMLSVCLSISCNVSNPCDYMELYTSYLYKWSARLFSMTNCREDVHSNVNKCAYAMEP